MENSGKDEAAKPLAAPQPTSSGYGTQAYNSAIGFMIGSVAAIGAVFTMDRFTPRQKQAVATWIEQTATRYGYKGLSDTKHAQMAVDFVVMNVAGTANEAAQYAMRRSELKHEKRAATTGGYELGRLVAGRTIGTVGGAMSLAFHQGRTPGFMARSDAALARWMSPHTTPPAPLAERMGHLITANFMQYGSYVGNAAGQLLYDKLVSGPSAASR
jgi:hypothetical protein